LKDLQKFLSQDLTIGGIDTVKDLIAKSRLVKSLAKPFAAL